MKMSQFHRTNVDGPIEFVITELDCIKQCYLIDRWITPTKVKKIVGSVTVLNGSLPCLAW